MAPIKSTVKIILHLLLYIGLNVANGESILQSHLSKMKSGTNYPIILVLDDLKGLHLNTHDHKELPSSLEERIEVVPLSNLYQLPKAFADRNSVNRRPKTKHNWHKRQKAHNRGLQHRHDNDRKDRYLEYDDIVYSDKQDSYQPDRYRYNKKRMQQSRLRTHQEDESNGDDNVRKVRERQRIRDAKPPLVKTLLRISNSLRCSARDDCQDNCSDKFIGKEKNDCEDKCDVKFECEEEEEEDDPCERGECDQSNECDTPNCTGSTVGEKLITEKPKCKRC